MKIRSKREKLEEKINLLFDTKDEQERFDKKVKSNYKEISDIIYKYTRDGSHHFFDHKYCAKKLAVAQITQPNKIINTHKYVRRMHNRGLLRNELIEGIIMAPIVHSFLELMYLMIDEPFISGFTSYFALHLLGAQIGLGASKYTSRRMKRQPNKLFWY